MPIYAYKCESCGHEQDVLQKLSEPVLTDCPACDQPALRKQLTAAGFQLKGSGWYVTDFRNGSSKSNGASSPSQAANDAPAAATSDKPAAAAAASGASAAPCGASCACH